MKALLIILLVVPLISFGQTPNTTFENTTCEMALQVCENNFYHCIIEDENQQEPNVLDCSGAIPSLFYSISSEGSQPYFFRFETFQNQSGTYILYGPLPESNIEACTQINANNAPYTYGNIVGGNQVQLPIVQGNKYILQVNYDNCINNNEGVCIAFKQNDKLRFKCKTEIECTNCISSFAPAPGDYVISAWVKEVDAPTGTTNYTKPAINLTFTGNSATYTVIPEGQIIDGWQRMEKVITIPFGSTAMDIELKVNSGEAYFDDIRFFPFDGSMMSYVYDPASLRLMAELDERNYATLYEYDEEGKLIRVKKETERGIMTIQENRDNISK